ncbi:MAG: PEP/pyruvate-binding domain-containing protein [Elusimicrobiota bacterium]
MIKFGTKAETLKRLARVITGAKVLSQQTFTVHAWNTSRKKVLNKIRNSGLMNVPMIVRSSAFSEDLRNSSMAGHFTSVPDVIGENGLVSAINKVISSFDNCGKNDQFFIQPMLSGILISGVVFSRDPNTGGNYIVINYDDVTGNTSTVTSGKSNETKAFYFYKYSGTKVPAKFSKIVNLVFELEELFSSDSLDIEFAVTKKYEIYLLQVRPLAFKLKTADTELHLNAIKDINRKISELNLYHPYLHGKRTVLGVMPDWNPAEMIGVRPRPLALSLYKELITDSIWAYQRDNYGYKNLRSFPLLYSFYGLPYIDLRVDFNSFVPADLKPELTERLVNYYIDQLIKFPFNHDKVEFEIVFSCYTLDLPGRLAKLRANGFSAGDCDSILHSLRNLTKNIINRNTGLWRNDLEKIKQLDVRRSSILNSPLDEISKIYWLIEYCKRYGTLPFAGLARAAFIAVQLLKSLVNVNILDQNEFNSFMEDLNTVGAKMTYDFSALSRKDFLERYGHLRPGTYDILSPRYDEQPDKYFSWNRLKHPQRRGKSRNFAFSVKQRKKTDALLKEHQLNYDAEGLFEFIKASIEGREYAKFIFTKSVSDSISLIKKTGNRLGFSTEQISYLDICSARELYGSSRSVKAAFGESITKGEKDYSLTCQLTLPPLIIKPEDVWSFHMPQFQPNFITLKIAEGNVAFVDSGLKNIKGAIVFIPNADPGYDWIFSHRILGFITMYGGVNSHMAIRAAELGIPAAIGCGETLFSKWSKAKAIRLDCPNKQVIIIR